MRIPVSELRAGVLIFFLLFCGCASATTLEVGSEKPYATVNAALSAASSGDTILIYPGTYTERISISNKHDLSFRGIDYPLIQYTASDNKAVFIIGENAYNTTIKGLNISNTGGFIQYSGGIRALQYETHGLIIEDNIINTVNGDAIWLDGIGLDPYKDSKVNCNDSRIVNNTITTTFKGRGICSYAQATNLTVAYNDVSTCNNISNISKITDTGRYCILVGSAIDSNVSNNIARSSAYSLIKVAGTNMTVENNTAYGKATHNCYEYGFMGGVYKNNTLQDTDYAWMSEYTGVQSLNHFYNPGSGHFYNTVFEDMHIINATTARIFSVAGHHEYVLVKNITLDTDNSASKLYIFGFSGTGNGFRGSNGLIVDNFTLLRHTSTTSPPFWSQGVGTDSTPTSHTLGDFSDIIRDNITFYDVKVFNNSYTYDYGVYSDSGDTNISLLFANSNLSIYHASIHGGKFKDSIEWFWFTDIDVMDNETNASTSRIFVKTNSTRHDYAEDVPYFTANYVDETQANYTYQQTAKGKLDTPEYIETLENGQTGTRENPNNCLLLASTTRNETTSKSVYYNLSVYGGSFSEPIFYTTPAGTSDIITVDASGVYYHLYGTKLGTVTGFNPTSAQYKENSYERGAVDLEIPITEYEKTVIPLGVVM